MWIVCPGSCLWQLLEFTPLCICKWTQLCIISSDLFVHRVLPDQMTHLMPAPLVHLATALTSLTSPSASSALHVMPAFEVPVSLCAFYSSVTFFLLNYFSLLGTGGIQRPPLLCFPGHYCPSGTMFPTQHKCPAGTWSDRSGLESESECRPCPRGWYCLAGVGTPSARCNSGHYCPEGTGAFDLNVLLPSIKSWYKTYINSTCSCLQ